MKECRKCDKKYEIDKNENGYAIYEFQIRGFCSRLCSGRWKYGYDDFVDPLHFHRNSNRIDTND